MAARDQGAYPRLIPGAHEYPGAWDVTEIDPDTDPRGANGPGTSKKARYLRVPRPMIDKDWLIRQHEFSHISRPDMHKSGNNWRDRIRFMLEEVAVDLDIERRIGLDPRPARFKFDFSKWSRPDTEYAQALEYIQVWSSAQLAPHHKEGASLLAYFNDVRDLVLAQDNGAARLAALDKACEMICKDFSPANCEVWADWLAAQWVPTKVEVPPPPMPPTGDGGGGGGGTPTPGTSKEEEDDSDEEDDDAGENEDAEGDELAEAGSETAEAGSEASQPSTEGQPTGTADAGQGAVQPGDGDAAQETEERPLLTAQDFSFDPLSRARNLDDEPAMPPEKRAVQNQRRKIAEAELQEAMEADAAARKQGVASQTDLLTGVTPYGLVDVHRHVFGKATSKTISTVWRSSDAGPTLKFPQYLYQGGRVFGVKAPGGTIVMDRSGSMSWHADIINEVMAKGLLPNVCVAHTSYHAKAYEGNNRYVCRMCITALNGRYDPVDPKTVESEHTGANSGMDPAGLYYAAKYLPKPIVWVSDGIVGGPSPYGGGVAGEEPSDYGRACDAVMRQYRIPRVITLEDAIAYLQGKAVPGWWQCATVDTRWVRNGSICIQSPGNNMTTMAEARKWARLRSQGRVSYR